MKLAAAVVGALALVAGAAHADPLDDAFAFVKPGAPGCAVGIGRKGEAPVTRAYGKADLESGAAFTPDTVSEVGSVSKQFTAMAILLLAQDGKLSLTDDVRKYVPEVPAYGAPITVDHLLRHTSGLRDWGEVAAVGGWPRGSRVYGHEEVLQIIGRQKALNHPPGEAYSYTNSGYNLLAIIVQRVSGRSLAAFTQERLFKPLGMTRTSWRDDYRRVVPGRAQAYAPAAGGFQLAMPFENVHGNSSLLTTAGDLLIWNEALETGRLGAQVTELLHQPTVLRNGRRETYARGIDVGAYRDARQISHSGGTGGYVAWLARYPEHGLSVALLCNTAAMPGDLPRKVADLYLPATLRTARPVTPPTPLPAPSGAAAPATPAVHAKHAGLYVQDGPLATMRMQAEGERLRIVGQPWMTPKGPNRFLTGVPGVIGEREIVFRPDGDMELHAADGEVLLFRHETPYTPPAGELAELAGTYASDEAANVVLSVRNGRLTMTPADRPSAATAMTPAFKDGFFRPGGLVRVLRDGRGRVTGLKYQGGRVFDLRFRKIS